MMKLSNEGFLLVRREFGESGDYFWKVIVQVPFSFLTVLVFILDGQNERQISMMPTGI